MAIVTFDFRGIRHSASAPNLSNNADVIIDCIADGIQTLKQAVDFLENQMHTHYKNFCKDHHWAEKNHNVQSRINTIMSDIQLCKGEIIKSPLVRMYAGREELINKLKKAEAEYDEIGKIMERPDSYGYSYIERLCKSEKIAIICYGFAIGGVLAAVHWLLFFFLSLI